MKVYVCLEEGDYDEYEVRKVFFCRKNADKWASNGWYYRRKYVEIEGDED